MDFLNQIGECFHDICIKAPSDALAETASKRQAFKFNMGGGVMGKSGAYKPQAYQPGDTV